jgi:hypothetical protein
MSASNRHTSNYLTTDSISYACIYLQCNHFDPFVLLMANPFEEHNSRAAWHYAHKTRAAHEIRTCLQLSQTRLRMWLRFCVIVSGVAPATCYVGSVHVSRGEANRSCVLPKHDWIRKTFTYTLIELKPLDEVTAAGFQTRSCHFQVAGIACADRCIRGEGGARAARQAAAIRK